MDKLTAMINRASSKLPMKTPLSDAAMSEVLQRRYGSDALSQRDEFVRSNYTPKKSSGWGGYILTALAAVGITFGIIKGGNSKAVMDFLKKFTPSQIRDIYNKMPSPKTLFSIKNTTNFMGRNIVKIPAKIIGTGLAIIKELVSGITRGSWGLLCGVGQGIRGLFK